MRRARPGGARAATRAASGAKGDPPVRLASDPIAIGLLVTLAALALARAAFTLAPGMWMWGLVEMRHLPAGAGWVPWFALALALLPAIGAAAAPWCARVGDLLTKPPQRGAALAALAGAALVWALPDRTLFLGDFAMRSGTVMTGIDP